MILVSVLSVTLLLYQILDVMIFMHALWGFFSVIHYSSKYPLCNPAALRDPRFDDLHACRVGILLCHT